MEMVSVFRKRNRLDLWITRLELTLLTALVFARTISVSSLEIVVPSRIVNEEDRLEFFGNISKDCTSRNCDENLNKKYLLTMLKYMNLGANPCNDFHEYACGNWDKFQKPPAPLYVAYNDYLKPFDNIFERWQQDDANEIIQSRNVVEEKLLTYYKSCQAITTRHALFKSYIQYLQEEEQVWQWERPTNWTVMLGKLGRFGSKTPFIECGLSTFKNKFVLAISPQSSENKLRLGKSILAALAKYTHKNMHELYMKLKEFEEELFEVTDGTEAFDTGLSGFVNSFLIELRNEESNDLVKVRSIAELMVETEYKVNWKLYLSTLLGRPVGSKEKIYIVDINAIKRITAFLDRSDSEMVQLYSTARFLRYLEETVPYSEDGQISGCITHTHQALPVLMNHFYDMKYYSKIRQQSDPVIKRIFDNLRNEFEFILKGNSMNLTNYELDFLREKIDSMRLNIGNIPENVSSSDYYNYAKKFELREGNFALNHLHVLRISTEYKLYLVGKENITDLNPLYFSHLSGDKVSPHYNLNNNKVILPFPYLQLPLYNEKFWDILLFGSFGSILGHEIIHGFDGEGSKLGSISSNSLYRANIACLQNGTEHLPERIADLSGVYLAMKAFRNQITETRDNMRLFFIKFGQSLCGTKKYLETFTPDRHDPSKVRVNYVVANIPEFAESFGCASGEQMNPETRCHLW